MVKLKFLVALYPLIFEFGFKHSYKLKNGNTFKNYSNFSYANYSQRFGVWVLFGVQPFYSVICNFREVVSLRNRSKEYKIIYKYAISLPFAARNLKKVL